VERDQFISVISEHRNLIFKICNSYCSDPEDRKDLQQEIMIQLWNSFTKFDGRVKISTWIYRVALNTAISFYRKDLKIRRNNVPINDSVITLNTVEPDSEQDRNVKLLYDFIERLNELDKALMILYLDDNSYKEISEVLGLSETNVATKISRTKKYLRDQFSNN
jgi:RNA polymerase sigma-70 factor (ECF subfamily)